MEMEAAKEAIASVAYAIVSPTSPSQGRETDSPRNAGLALFQWGGTISAIFLLILNCFGRRSSIQSFLLVMYLLTSLPTMFLEIFREQFGHWVAFLTVAGYLINSHIFPVSPFLLFVITPDWLAYGLRDSIDGGIFCMLIGVSVVLVDVRGCNNRRCNWHCFGFYLGIAFLFLFTLLYLCLGPS